VAKENPDLQRLLFCMLSSVPSERPTSDTVAKTVEGFMGKLTVLSLDRSKSRGDGALLLRVEGKEMENIMSLTQVSGMGDGQFWASVDVATIFAAKCCIVKIMMAHGYIHPHPLLN